MKTNELYMKINELFYIWELLDYFRNLGVHKTPVDLDFLYLLEASEENIKTFGHLPSFELGEYDLCSVKLREMLDFLTEKLREDVKFTLIEEKVFK